MKLYYTSGACSLVVRIVLNELGCDFFDEAVDLKTKLTASGTNFRDINPKGSVPAIALDNGHILTENQVILQYLVDISTGQKLLAPVGDMKRYHTLELMNYISTEVHKSIGYFFNPQISEDMKSKVLIPAILARFAFLDERLVKGPYLMGDHISLPDAYLYVMLRWAHYLKFELTPYKHLHQFFETMQARPAVKKSLIQEKL